MSRACIEPILEAIPAARQEDARHYGVHPWRMCSSAWAAGKSSRKCAILTDRSAEKGHLGGTPKWAGEPPSLPMTFSVFGFFVVKELFMRWRMSDFLTGDNGDNPDSESGIPNRDSLFSLFVPVESLPIQYGFGCPWNAVFWSFLRLFAENQHNLFAINNLQPKMSISN
jgi:hypothetical protein